MGAVSHQRASTDGKKRNSHDDANVTLRALLHAQGVLVDDAVDGEQEGRPREVTAGVRGRGGTFARQSSNDQQTCLWTHRFRVTMIRPDTNITIGETSALANIRMVRAKCSAYWRTRAHLYCVTAPGQHWAYVCDADTGAHQMNRSATSRAETAGPPQKRRGDRRQERRQRTWWFADTSPAGQDALYARRRPLYQAHQPPGSEQVTFLQTRKTNLKL